MAEKRAPTPAELRLRAKRLLAAAGSALAEPLAVVAGFKNAKAFKAELIKSLETHPEFHQAAHDLHGMHMQIAGLKAPKLSDKSRGPVRPSGRVQATRNEPSHVQWDRSRGKRAKGGQRIGRQTRNG